jgi:hypothetical protein
MPNNIFPHDIRTPLLIFLHNTTMSRIERFSLINRRMEEINSKRASLLESYLKEETVGFTAECEIMCPPLERQERELTNMLSPFEKVPNTELTSEALAIKRYVRPAAGDVVLPCDVRTISCLMVIFIQVTLENNEISF